MIYIAEKHFVNLFSVLRKHDHLITQNLSKIPYLAWDGIRGVVAGEEGAVSEHPPPRCRWCPAPA